jgi:hypothetical protein
MKKQARSGSKVSPRKQPVVVIALRELAQVKGGIQGGYTDADEDGHGGSP